MRAIRCLLLSALVLSFAACGGGSKGTSAAQCNDGKDNDGDGKIDFPDDEGCTSPEDDTENSPPAPQCNDGRDNDGDGKIDFPNDPGCYAPNQNDETDDCPDGSDCPQCSNGKDDDGNGATDYPADTGCTSAADNDEYPSNPLACGQNVHILALPTSGDAMGMLMSMGTSSLSSPMCGGAGAEDVYELRIRQPTVVVATTVAPNTSADTILYIRSAQCSNPSSELACNDNASVADVRAALTLSITMPGTYYLVVDDRTGQGGSYELQVATYPGEGVACTADECGPGLVCRVPMGQTDKVCAKPVCSDGVDDDGDGKNDYPDDPGCQSPSDDDESDNCPNGSGCPKCSNGRDDDTDTKIDYPADTSCSSAASNAEVCKTTEAVAEIVGPTTLGDNTNGGDDYAATCAGSTGGLDVAYELELPKLTSFTYSVEDPNSSNFFAAALLGPTCGGTELGCFAAFDDPKTVGPLAAGSYFLVVDGDDSFEVGPFTVTISGTIAGGQSCESPLVASGALSCSVGYTCGGTPGARTCVPTACNDGIDNNGDGKIDYPNDPGCDSPSDTMEDTVCPGASCPVCSNGSDDDTDMKTDFPADFGCSSAAGTSEVFCSTEVDPVVAITTATTTSTFAGMHANESFSCGVSDLDRVFVLELPVSVESLTVDTLNSANTDTVLQISDPQCGTSIACNDDIDIGTNDRSSITLSSVAAGNYAIEVSTYDATTNPGFKVNVKGTVAKGTACTGTLFTANVLKCETGSTCTARHVRVDDHVVEPQVERRLRVDDVRAREAEPDAHVVDRVGYLIRGRVRQQLGAEHVAGQRERPGAVVAARDLHDEAEPRRRR
jgi:hypothetical protein